MASNEAGGEGEDMAVRAGAGAGVQQRLHQHPHDRHQAQVRRPLGARPHRADQGVHPGKQSPISPVSSDSASSHVAAVQLLKELDAPVEHIVLPTFAYEHKVFFGPFTRKFPRAQIWVAPRQWSWPINLPLEFFGIFRAKPLQDEDDDTPWAGEIEQKMLSSPEVGSVTVTNQFELLFHQQMDAIFFYSCVQWCESGDFRDWTLCGGGILPQAFADIVGDGCRHFCSSAAT